MNVQSKWDIDISQFNAAMEQAVQRQRRAADAMKRESAGIGDGFTKGLGGLQNILAAGGVTLGLSQIGQGIKSALTSADDLADLGLKLKESTETLQRMDFVAQQTASVGVEQLAGSFIKLEKNLGDVENTAAREALARYGITAGQLVAMPLDQKMLAIADAFQQARASGTGVADLMDLLGRSAPELIPMLEQTGDTLRALLADAPVVSDQDIQRMAQINDQWDALVMKAKSFGVEFVGSMVAGATALSEGFSGKSLQQQGIDAFQRESALDAHRAAQAAAMDQLTATQERLALEKEIADTREKAEKAVATAREKLEAQRSARLSPQDRLAQLFGKTLDGTGIDPSEGKAGLEKMIKGYDTDHGREKQVPYIDALREAEAIEAEIAADRLRTEQEIATLREQAAAGEFRLLSPAQQGETLRRRLGSSFGVDIQSAQQINDGLSTLQLEAADAARSGDAAREKAALEKLRKAQDDAAALGALNLGAAPDSSGGYQANGEVARTFNLLLGRSADNPVLDESKRQTNELQKMNTTLAAIKDKLGDTFEDL